ncbi:MAG: beta-propeller domain-containing protein [Myxococcales bacterium]|nr:beta-propeller domain-containing protein [Myxococcales bacterium]
MRWRAAAVAAMAAAVLLACGGDRARDEARPDPELVGGKADIPSWLAQKGDAPACGKRLSGEMRGFDSAHLYALAAEKDTVYTLSYQAGYQPDRGAVVAVYDASGKLVERSRDQSAQASALSFTAKTSGSYLVAVYSVRWWASGGYQLSATCGVAGLNERVKNATDFLTYEQPPRIWRFGLGPLAAETARSPQADNAPSGRSEAVEEGDIYKVVGDRLLYFNTYRGLMIFDISDTKNPQLLSRVPVFGYPVEMYVQNGTAYALLRDTLELTRGDSGKLALQRKNVSQIVAIDVRDGRQPKVLGKRDIVGQLREGVSRKVGNVIYVVSYRSRYYWYGWQNSGEQPQEGAWAYSFDVSNPRELKKVDELEIFRGGGFADSNGNSSERRTFSSVAISATSNVLMVVENWRKYGSVRDSSYNCGTYTSLQQAIVSLVDISDPQGQIKLHTRFETYGELTDQFKQTYVHDPNTGKGTYYGIFARREWTSQDCRSQSRIENNIEAWDVSNSASPKQLSRLQFGKPNETVRGSVFDSARKVAFAITARNVDPFYAIDLSQPSQLKVLSQIDGLSGDMNVFRFIAKQQFLIGIGRDNSAECTGFDGPGQNRFRTNVAVSIIDVRDLAKIRLVQRKCVAVENASWIGSAVNQNLDQAHKLIGMHSDGLVNVLTVPVYYSKKVERSDSRWWWYRYETAVGVLSWDLSKYDPSKSETEQDVLATHGTVVHENGNVRRSILFTEQGAASRRKLINLSDTHMTLVDVQDLDNPSKDASIELAPYVAEIYKVGSHLVEQVRSSPWDYGDGVASDFRVRAAGGDLDKSKVVATFTVSQVERVLQHKDALVIVRRVAQQGSENLPWSQRWQKQVVVYDLSNPSKPTLRGTATLPMQYIAYYRYFCGTIPYWWGNLDASGHSGVAEGIVFLSSDYDESGMQRRRLTLLDLRSLDAPGVSSIDLDGDSALTLVGIASDPQDDSAVLITSKRKEGSKDFSGTTFDAMRYSVQRYVARGGKLVADGAAVNIPGRLVKVLSTNGQRVLLAQDERFEKQVSGEGAQQSTFFRSHPRLHLLTEAPGGARARLRDSRDFIGLSLRDLVAEGRRLYVGASKAYSYYVGPILPLSGTSTPAPQPSDELEEGTRLFVFDLGQNKLSQQFSENTKASNLDIMGLSGSTLLFNLVGEGVLTVDVSSAASPEPRSFVRTLGYASHVVFDGDRALVASGYYGVYQVNTTSGSL